MGAGGVQWNAKEKRLIWYNLDVPYADVVLPTNARVLDVGGGSDPHPAAHIIVDKFIDYNAHRPGEYPLGRECEFITKLPDGSEQREKRTIQIVCADAVSLPFPDKSFDFVIAKDVLEHIDDVRSAMAEISRVGRAGIIDVPRLSSEMLFPQGTDIHRWVFDHTPDNGIIAHSVANFYSPFGRLMHDIFAENKSIREAWARCRHHFHLVFLWKDSIDCTIGEEIQTP